MHEKLNENAQLALDTILRKPVKGIPHKGVGPMEHRMRDRLAGVTEGTYREEPVPTTVRMMCNTGCCIVDQFIPNNALAIGDHGYEAGGKTATTGLKQIVVDGMVIDSPEATVAHLEQYAFPRLRAEIAKWEQPAEAMVDEAVRQICAAEDNTQSLLGPDILKVPYGGKIQHLPYLRYQSYGYENYFMAYALYPEVIEQDFALQADLAIPLNRISAAAYRTGNLPPLLRLDHDMADSRGTLVDVKSLDKIWFPHFARAIKPLLEAGVSLIWHCDGNLMQMVPRLLEVGLQGFQGFQYEDGMDYEKICRMKTRDGDSLIIQAGVSVTRTLPMGTPEDVRKEMKWLVEHGPRAGLFLGPSSSIAPGVPWENLQVMVEGLNYYREHGRN